MSSHEIDGNSNPPWHVDSPEAAGVHQSSSSGSKQHKSHNHENEFEREYARSIDKERERGHDKHRHRDRARDREGTRERDRDKDRDKVRDRDRHHRDHHVDRSERRERTKVRDGDGDYYRRRDYDRASRRRDYDGDKEDKHSHRSRSRSKSRSEQRSRSRSRSLSKSKRTSGFDMAPPGTSLPNVAAVSSAVAAQIPGTTSAIPGIFPNMLPLMSGQFGALPFMPVQAMTQQATRHARRVYVGGLPAYANEQTVGTFFNHVMSAVGGNAAGPGDAVVNVYINYEKKFAFVEMRSVEEASNAMALDGIIFEGAPLKVRRSSDYNPSMAATLGPSQPNPNLNLVAVGLIPGSAGGLEGPDRVFVGGLPYYFTESQIRELLESFGPLRGFDLVKDRETGNSKGYAFCVYQDLSVTDIACAALNGIKMGDKTLTVRRANQGMTQLKPEQESVLLHAQQQIALQRLMLQPTLVPSKVVCLTEAVDADELKNDDDYEDILYDMRNECGKFGNYFEFLLITIFVELSIYFPEAHRFQYLWYFIIKYHPNIPIIVNILQLASQLLFGKGTLVNVIIPRPLPDIEPSGVGKVFLEYADIEGATRARQGLNGRKFDKNSVVAMFYPEDKFSQGYYNG